jgi:CDP-paratose 2-epimerase
MTETGHLLVTGGAGFIGSHTARRFLTRGWRVTVYDNLTRVGASHALDWLRAHPNAERLSVVVADVREYEPLASAAAPADAILHAAGQTAVTTSVLRPRQDFEDNALGTLNVLEAARASARHPAVIFTSTNKVYGGMDDVAVQLDGDRYGYVDLPLGAPETQPLDFHSPYGCSKGAADQYVRDYARIYRMRTVVYRQSCIYGHWQFGTEDQGWLAHFAISAVLDTPITIYGDGRQARDALYIDDLVDAFELAIARREQIAGRIYNVGGGPENILSLLDLIKMLEEMRGRPMAVSYGDWRPGDQRIYVSDIRKIHREMGWKPKIDVPTGVERLYRWAEENRDLLARIRQEASNGS